MTNTQPAAHTGATCTGCLVHPPANEVRYYNGKPGGDTYAIELLCPSQYDRTQMVRTVVYRNVHARSALDAARVVPDSEQSRIIAIYPERF